MTLPEFRAALKTHDWFYAYSDDGKVYKKGFNESQALISAAKAGGDTFKQLYNFHNARKFQKINPANYTYPFAVSPPIAMDDPMF